MYKDAFVEREGEAKQYKQIQTETALSDFCRPTCK